MGLVAAATASATAGCAAQVRRRVPPVTRSFPGAGWWTDTGTHLSGAKVCGEVLGYVSSGTVQAVTGLGLSTLAARNPWIKRLPRKSSKGKASSFCGSANPTSGVGLGTSNLTVGPLDRRLGRPGPTRGRGHAGGHLPGYIVQLPSR